MTPSTAITKTDGNLGVSSDTEKILAVIAPASAGTLNVATSITSKNDLTAAFTSGPLVEACAYMIARGIPVVAIRSSPTTNGTFGTIVHSGVLGTATIAGATATHPDADYDVIVKIVTGGTVGVAGITYTYSLDNGVNYSAETALGTSTTMTLARGVAFTLTSTETFLANDTFNVPTIGPKNLTADLATSLTALSDYSGEWLRVLVYADADSTILGQLDSFAKSFHADGKYPEVITNTRHRDVAGSESRATYQTAMAAIAAAVQSTEVSCCVDACEIVSEIDGRRLRQPAAYPYVARLMLIDDSHDAAAKADGALTGVFLETAAGARNYHDERRYPGLDALGFTTLRTWGGRPITPGVYVNNPRLLGGAGSDYRYFQLSALLNRAIEKAFQLANNRLSQSVLLDSTTGKIREDVARSVEESISAELRTSFQDSGRCSSIRFILSRTDNVLSTDTVHFDVQMLPLAYVKKFIGKAGLVRTLPN